MANRNPRKRNYVIKIPFDICPIDGAKFECIDSRPGFTSRRRRYKCPTCNTRHSTTEISLEEFQRMNSQLKQVASFKAKLAEMQAFLDKILDSPEFAFAPNGD